MDTINARNMIKAFSDVIDAVLEYRRRLIEEIRRANLEREQIEKILDLERQAVLESVDGDQTTE